jgi:CRP-like cAMP-binding protein
MLRGVPRDVALSLSKRCRWCWFERSQAILHQQDGNREVYFVVRGRACEMYFSLTGREMQLRNLQAGEMFGELSAIDAMPQAAAVVAAERTLTASMPASVFWETMSKYETFAMEVVRGLAGLARMMSCRAIELGTFSVQNRIHAELLRCSRPKANVRNMAVISPMPTHSAFASCIGTHREAVTRELGELTRAGLVEKKKGQLIIRDVAELVAMVTEVVGDIHLPAGENLSVRDRGGFR